MDSTQDTEQTVANGEVSENVGKPNSFDAEAFENKVLNAVKEMISDPRIMQSQKDKVIAEIKKDKGFRDFFREYSSMKQTGMTDREIEQEFRIKELEERNANNTTGSSVHGDKLQTAQVLVKALGFEDNDPDVMQVLLSTQNTEQQAVQLSELAMRKNKTANPALLAQETGKGTSTDLMSEYKSRASTLRGDALINLKMEYRKKGLNIT